ncbi:hypothetical protein [Stutzerimonas stutzeri]|uniref:hypothetical protein n=1 Tax=Stutzerimonas stutzeri TaxID=316 RepID=UPI00210E7A06|nr:hypothetical protein [Stutzerimonas stutzeri]MCQ4320994.1 hypothetical protein [Stutzerimonas stutzeri]
MFDNRDFGYHKVSIERPDRCKAQFSAERIETLRYDKALREPMQWIYQQWGDTVYQDETLATHEKAIHHSLAAHRPLGSIMRARLSTY